MTVLALVVVAVAPGLLRETLVRPPLPDLLAFRLVDMSDGEAQRTEGCVVAMAAAHCGCQAVPVRAPTSNAAKTSLLRAGMLQISNSHVTLRGVAR